MCLIVKVVKGYSHYITFCDSLFCPMYGKIIDIKTYINNEDV